MAASAAIEFVHLHFAFCMCLCDCHEGALSGPSVPCVCVCCLLQLGGEEGGTNETAGTLKASQAETGYECERKHTYRSGECHNHDTVTNRNVFTYLSSSNRCINYSKGPLHCTYC